MKVKYLLSYSFSGKLNGSSTNGNGSTRMTFESASGCITEERIDDAITITTQDLKEAGYTDIILTPIAWTRFDIEGEITDYQKEILQLRELIKDQERAYSRQKSRVCKALYHQDWEKRDIAKLFGIPSWRVDYWLNKTESGEDPDDSEEESE